MASLNGPLKSILEWPFGGCLSALVVLLAQGKSEMSPKRAKTDPLGDPGKRNGQLKKIS